MQRAFEVLSLALEQRVGVAALSFEALAFRDLEGVGRSSEEFRRCRKGSEGIGRDRKESEGVRRSPKEFKGVQGIRRNQKESEGVGKDPEKSEVIGGKRWQLEAIGITSACESASRRAPASSPPSAA